MALIIPFVNKETRQKGFTIGNLPLPNGDKRAYKEYGREAIALILKRWKEDCRQMRAAQAN